MRVAHFAALGFPSVKDEEWRFTNLAPLRRIPFEPGKPEPFHYHGPALPKGVVVCSLAEAIATHWPLVEPHLARYADYTDHAFTALNTAFLRDGAFVYIPPGVVVEQPIDLGFIAPPLSKPVVRHRRCLIVTGPGSQASVVERHEGVQGTYFTNAVTEVFLAETAVLDYHLVQRESNEAYHVATLQVQQERGSRFTSSTVALGGVLRARTSTWCSTRSAAKPRLTACTWRAATN